MAITYSAGTGSLITSPAMNETCIAQTDQTGNNTIVVSDDIVAAGNGQIGTKYPDYVNRLVIKDFGLSTEERRNCIAAVAIGAPAVANSWLLTVHEDWDVNPVVTTDTVSIAYDVDDIETGGASGGIGLNARTGLYELTNLLTVQSGGILQNSFGQALEVDDRGSNTGVIVQSGGLFVSGFEAGGSPVNGGIFTSYNNTTGEPNWQIQSGGEIRFYDAVIWAQLVAQQFECADGCIGYFNGSKLVSNSDELHLYDSTVINSSVGGRASATDITRIDAGTVIDGLVLSNIEYIDSRADIVVETITAEGLLFSGVPGFVNVRQNKTWNLIDPIWTVTAFGDLTWTGTATGNELNDRRSIKATVQTAAGTKLQDALVNVYEDTILADLVLELVTAATTGFAEDSFIYRKHATNSVTTTYGGHALQCGKWLYTPLVFTQASDEKFNGVITLSLDPNIVQTTQATAITDGTGITWNEDANASSIIAFTGGVNTLAVGETVTGGTSGATGIVTQIVDGDSVAGTVHLRSRNGTAFTAGGEALSSSGTWTGTLTASSEQRFAIWIDFVTKSYQAGYDYIAALTTEATLSATGELIWEWCRDQQAQALYLTGAGFSTERSYGKGIIGVNGGAGTVDHFTDDAGGTYTPPATVTITVTATFGGTPVEGAAVYLETTGGVVLLDALTNSSGVATAAYGGTTPVTIDSDVSGVKSSSGPVPYEYFTLGGTVEAITGYSATALLGED